MRNNISHIENIDEFLTLNKIYQVDFNTIVEYRKKFIMESVKYFLENNQFYKKYCDSLGVSLKEMENDLNVIPKIPSSVFKKATNLLQVNGKQDTYISTSSGTQGTLSKVPRNSTTMMRLFSSMFAGIHEVMGIKNVDTQLMVLSPPNHETEHLWIAYALSGMAFHYNSEFYISSGKIQVEKFIDDIFRYNDRCAELGNVVIVGTPVVIFNIIKILSTLEKKLSLGNKCFVISAGGWKKNTGERIEEKEFRHLVAKTLGLKDVCQVFDAFNMVELNSVIYECPNHHKHCPPWLYVRAYNPWTLEVCKEGELGILGYLDCTTDSFPGFVLSDDFGRVYEAVQCECGIVSDIVKIERRINKLESRGCALKI